MTTGPADGLGWLLDYVGLLLRELHLPLGYVLDELPMMLGWALVCWALYRHPTAPMEIAGDGYVRQEMYRILEQRGISSAASDHTMR